MTGWNVHCFASASSCLCFSANALSSCGSFRRPRRFSQDSPESLCTLHLGASLICGRKVSSGSGNCSETCLATAKRDHACWPSGRLLGGERAERPPGSMTSHPKRRASTRLRKCCSLAGKRALSSAAKALFDERWEVNVLRPKSNDRSPGNCSISSSTERSPATNSPMKSPRSSSADCSPAANSPSSSANRSPAMNSPSSSADRSPTNRSSSSSCPSRTAGA
mmetsp:Transcript_44013/g.93668  ORF Transcript_44013/g.93668 Transcript_44013/m.93668 type:complete len:222 (+) Transcript_44013:388-1053(+)